MRRLPWSLIWGIVALVLLGSACFGGEIVVTRPEYKGTRFNTPVPRSMHHVNEGGSDGAGLCVIASALVAGQYQGIPALRGGKDSALWRAAKSRPGGYYPEKLTDLLGDVMPGEKYASITDRAARPALMAKLSRQGYVLSTKMNTGELYQMQPIHHFVNYVHFDNKRNVAALRDNNDRPGVFRVITAAEAARRSVDGGQFWLFVWLRRPLAQPEAAAGNALLLVLAGCLLFVMIRDRRRVAEESVP